MCAEWFFKTPFGFGLAFNIAVVYSLDMACKLFCFVSVVSTRTALLVDYSLEMIYT